MTQAKIDWGRAKEVFADMLEAPEADRNNQLISVCGDDTRTGSRTLREPITVEAPKRIGPYEIHEVIGEGGFGIVYRATQQTPIKREVAIKLLKHGMENAKVLHRFRAEQDVLGRMAHPNIATVLDAGSTDDGRPFVTMELLKGEAITTYCRNHNLNLKQRAELMSRVCNAIHHTHQRAVIHRDIKPSNIIVTEVDGKPQPNIIDFGIAKVMSETQREDFTRTGDAIGTPRYMSPEQIRGDEGADIRVDVYSLGVVLCETLTGAVPRDPGSMSGRPLREVPAERPSRLVLKSLKGDTQEGATLASTKELRGDLDRIILKCVEWEPDRRYRSAAALADDLDRYLNGEPVLAVGPSAIYAARKFLTRHKLAASLVVLAIISMVSGTILAVLGQRQALKQSAIAEAAREDAVHEAQRTKFAIQFLLEDMLTASDPDAAYAVQKPLTVQQLLEAANYHAQTRLQDDPRSRFEILGRIGSGFVTLRNSKEAIEPLRKAIEIGQTLGPSVLEDVLNLRLTLAEALGVFERDSQEITDEMFIIRTEVNKTAIKTLGLNHPVTTRSQLALLSRNEEPEIRLAEINSMLEIENGDMLLKYELLVRKGRALRELKRFEEEVEVRFKAINIADELYAPGHSGRIGARYHSARSLAAVGRGDEAVAMLEDILALPPTTIEPNHPGRMSALAMMITLHLQIEEYEKAIALCLEAEAIARKYQGYGTFNHILSAQLLATALKDQGSYANAEKLLDAAGMARDTISKSDKSRIKEFIKELGLAMSFLSEHERALTLFNEAINRYDAEDPAIVDLLIAKGKELDLLQLEDELRKFKRSSIHLLEDAEAKASDIERLKEAWTED